MYHFEYTTDVKIKLDFFSQRRAINNTRTPTETVLKPIKVNKKDAFGGAGRKKDAFRGEE